MTSKSASPPKSDDRTESPGAAGAPRIVPLFTEVHIAERVTALAAAIAAEAPPAGPLVVIGVLRGAVPFVADLARALERLAVPLVIDYISASSYSGRASTGRVVIDELPSVPLAGRDVLIVDDILDTGLTMAAMLESLGRAAPGRLRTCVLLDKRSRRLNDLAAEFVGFACPDQFVVGYGMDLDGRFRELPFIGTVDTSGG
jgi:hypoxanthine phosphoribosyltransferase